ncbi:MAG TPA: ABC transporter permease [Planctomycetota bacterium]|nr:ABC transporter permease [Planctomycetota bacterium]
MRQLSRNIRLGIKNLLLHKLRTALTMLGMVFGVGSVIAMLSVGEGASKEALEQIRKLGSNNIIISSMKPVEETSSGSAMSRLSIYGLLYADETRISETFPQVERTVPVKLVRKEGSLGNMKMELRVVGTTWAWFELVQREVVAGRVLLARDQYEYNNAVVLTEHGARRLLATQNTIGQPLKIGRDYYEVVGIVKSEASQSGGLQTPDQEVDAYIPINLARERYGDTSVRRSAGSTEREKVELHQLIVQTKSSDDVEEVATGIEAMLKRFHKKTDYRLSIPLALLRQAEATKRTFNIVLGSIAGISLLVGGIGIMNIMLASVMERTKEIGIRRAIGARRAQIITQFLIETVVLSTLGGIIGLIIGVLIPWTITYFAGMPTVVTLFSLVLSLSISLAIGIVFGLYPAIRAAKLDPIIALRHE